LTTRAGKAAADDVVAVPFVNCSAVSIHSGEENT